MTNEELIKDLDERFFNIKEEYVGTANDLETFILQALKNKDDEWRGKIEREIKKLSIDIEECDTAIQNDDFNEFFTRNDAEKMIIETIIRRDILEQLLK